jgi:hypothetical protein
MGREPSEGLPGCPPRCLFTPWCSFAAQNHIRCAGHIHRQESRMPTSATQGNLYNYYFPVSSFIE